MWYPYRVLHDAGLSSALATLATYLLAMLCGAFVLPRVWHEISSAGWWAIGLLLSAGWSNLGYVLAVLHGEVMRVVLLFYLAPLWTVLFSYWLLDERLNRYGYLIVFLSFCGAVVMLGSRNLGCRFRAILPNGPACRQAWLSHCLTWCRGELHIERSVEVV